MSGSSTSSGQFFTRKAYEICYALMRVASSMKKQSFAEHLEGQALLLLESVAAGEYQRADAAIAATEYLLRIGTDVGFVHEENARVVIKELTGLKSAIAEFGNAAKVQEVNLENIFTEITSTLSFPPRSGNPVENLDSRVRPENDSHSNGSQHNGDGYGSLENGNGHSVAKAAIRQSAILERIRQWSNLPDRQVGCRLKEIQDILPAVSERTLRYDVQNLIEQGLVERIGNGGPATSYKVTVSA
ncbi:MAG: hypothetical protein AAB897_01340 [Patescibacteria group bacterium]